MPTAPRSPDRRHTVVLVAAVIVAVALLGGHSTLAAATTTLLPTDRTGSGVTISPAVVRAPQGTAELDIEVGSDASEDVVVALRLAPPSVTDDGTVSIGDGTAPGTVASGSRLRPGEALRVTVTDLEGPTLVVAEVRAPGGDAASATPAALVLPGELGEPPTVVVRTLDGGVEATVSATSALVVTARVRGREATTFPDRLVLPDASVVLTVPAAGWPRPSEITVTDEGGRTVTATTGTAALALVALVLVLAAAAAAVTVRRRHRLSGD